MAVSILDTWKIMLSDIADRLERFPETVVESQDLKQIVIEMSNLTGR